MKKIKISDFIKDYQKIDSIFLDTCNEEKSLAYAVYLTLLSQNYCINNNFTYERVDLDWQANTPDKYNIVGVFKRKTDNKYFKLELDTRFENEPEFITNFLNETEIIGTKNIWK